MSVPRHGSAAPGGSRPAPGRASGGRCSSVELAGAHRGRLVGLGVVVAEDVEDAVDHEQRQLVVDRAGVRRRLLDGHRRAHDDVAEQHRARRAAWPSSSSASSGNDSTSVGPSWPRCSALRAAISSRSTNVSVSSPRRPRRRGRRAARAGPAVDVDGDAVGRGLLVGGHHDRRHPERVGAVGGTRRLAHRHRPPTRRCARRPRRCRRRCGGARRRTSTRCTNARPSMPLSTRSRPDQPALAVGHVDLGDVAGDDDARAEADAGQEHLHLLGRRVLRLVEDDEAVVERAAAHERQRGDLDGLALEQPLRALRLDHVVQGVVQRAQVRVDLRHQVAGQEAEPLAGLDGRAGEDDPLDLLGLQRLDGHRHRQPRLAGAGRADAERDDVVGDGVDVALLAGRLRAGPGGPWRRAGRPG